MVTKENVGSSCKIRAESSRLLRVGRDEVRYLPGKRYVGFGDGGEADSNRQEPKMKKQVDPERKQKIEQAFISALHKVGARKGSELPASKIIKMFPDLKIDNRTLADLKIEISERTGENENKKDIVLIGSNRNGYFLIESWDDAIEDERCYSKIIMNMLAQRRRRKRLYLKKLGHQMELGLK